ncbi:MAG: LysR family transcriptional regulator [Rhodospirillaceae bacterium]|nr:LysR family transcriptional regulator [Rhodospirillaceae bacterium]
MEMQQLRHFLMVAKHQKLLAAAEELNMSQSALTRSIKALETSVGAPLFEREARGVRLTVFGKSLAAHAYVILNETKKALNELSALKGGTKGTIVIGVGPNYASHILPQAITQLLAERPNIEIIIHEGNMEDLLPSLRVGNLDLLFLIVPHPIADPDLTFEPLIQEKMIVVARAGHPLARRRIVSAEEAAKCSWIISDQILLLDNITREFFVRYGISVEKNTVVNAKSISFRKAAIMESDMLTLIPAHVVATEIRDNVLARINLERLEHDFPAGIIYSVRGTQPTAVVELIRKIRSTCKAQQRL